MDPRVLLAGEADIPEFPRPARVDERRVGALLVEDPVRILVAEDLVWRSGRCAG
jgi:hypothetical protein